MAVRTPRAGVPGRPRLLAPVIAIIAALLVLGGIAVSLYTDFLWFRSVDKTTVFTTVLRTRVLLFFGFGLVMALLVGSMITVAYRVRPPFRPMSLEQQNLERYRVAVEPYLVPVLLLVSGVFGVFAGLSAASRWQTWLLWRNATPFGQTDPQFGRDVSYYAMTYPFHRFVLSFLITALVLALLASLATHYLFGGLRLQTQGDKLSPAARAHLSVLVGVLVLLKAGAYYLDRFGLAFSTRGVVQGASYTDVNAVLPAKNILVFVALICAVLCFANIVVRNILLPAGALGLLVLSAVVLGGIFPAYTQQFRVKPNEVQRESEFISRNIAATREAYGIADAELQQYDPREAAAADAAQAPTVQDARLLDPNVVAPAFEQLQRFRSYFGVADDLDIDRYTVGGELQDYVVAAREVDQRGLQPNQRNWINERLTYTHGNGLILAPANGVDANGQPSFSVRDVPPVGDIAIDQPRIYFGESSPSYSVVNTQQGEIDGPTQGDTQTTFNYDGRGGIQLGSPLRKIAFALKFREPNLLLSGAIQDDSRLLNVREPRDRVKKVAPFLELDGDPYPAVVGGKIVWIVDGYTTSAGYPYGEQRSFGEVVQDSTTRTTLPQRQVNYIRNSVKATVDAYTGEVTLYRFGPTDPVLETWGKAFGGILRPESDISPELRAHLRYPEDLFKVQRELLAQYHVTDAGAFYNKEDFWRVPSDPAQPANRGVNQQQDSAAPQQPQAAASAVAQAAAGQNVPDQPPYYALLGVPGAEDPQFRLSTSFVSSNGANLSAFATVSSDPGPEYGKIRVLQLPRGVTVPGPGNVLSQFLADQDVANVLRDLGQTNTIEFGNLLTLPVANGLLYVQPVFVTSRSGTNAFPRLQQVIVGFGQSTVTAPTFSEALGLLFTGSAPPTTPPTSPGTTPPPTTGPAVPPDLAAAVAEADAAFREGQAAFGRGDFPGYAAAQQRLQAALTRLVELQRGAATPTATPSSPTPSSPTPSSPTSSSPTPTASGSPTPAPTPSP